MSDTKPGQVFSLIPQAMEEIGAIAKTERNTFHKYDYRGIDSIYNAFSRPLAKCGLFIVSHAAEVLSSREVRTKKDGTQLEMVLAVTFRIYAPDESYVEFSCIGAGMDSGDKSAAKAHTAAFKVLCFEVFLPPIEDDSDGDKDSPEREELDRPPPPPPNPSPLALAKLALYEWTQAYRDAADLRPDAVNDKEFLVSLARAMYGAEGATTVERVEAMREAIEAGGCNPETGEAP